VQPNLYYAEFLPRILLFHYQDPLINCQYSARPAIPVKEQIMAEWSCEAIWTARELLELRYPLKILPNSVSELELELIRISNEIFYNI
jgi:hypothetical protein